MPQLDHFTYLHQCYVAGSIYFYIFVLVSFFYAPSVFLRPRLLFLVQTYCLHYVQFMMFFISNFFDLKNFTSFSDYFFNEFFIKGFGSLYLFYKKNQFSFFALYFSSLANYKLFFSERLVIQNYISSVTELEVQVSNEFFLNTLFTNLLFLVCCSFLSFLFILLVFFCIMLNFFLLRIFLWFFWGCTFLFQV